MSYFRYGNLNHQKIYSYERENFDTRNSDQPVALSCQNAPEKGKVTQIDPETWENSGHKRIVQLNGEGVLLENQNAGITSKFKVRNFEFSVRVKSSPGTRRNIILCDQCRINRFA